MSAEPISPKVARVSFFALGYSDFGALGAVVTVQGIGASLSGLAAGVNVDHFGYGTTFLTAGLTAALALGVCFLLMPETAPHSNETSNEIASSVGIA
jgi:sugar phosphate permease